MMINHPKEEVKKALERVQNIVYEEGNLSDIAYFNYHKARYYRMAVTLMSYQSDEELSVLNMGSHYLHVSLLFEFLGYKVDSMDVSEFWNTDFIKLRAQKFHLKQIVDDNFETLESINGSEDKYDIILFTEILEHITFNPIVFWQKIYTLIKNNGLIYISTPNSMSLSNIVKSITRILAFRGIGIPVNEIFNNVTYGHHWKEYSSSEIKRYFNKMSDDFKVITTRYHYKKIKIESLTSGLTAILSFIGNSIFLSDDIEAIIKVNKSDNWKIKPPKY